MPDCLLHVTATLFPVGYVTDPVQLDGEFDLWDNGKVDGWDDESLEDYFPPKSPDDILDDDSLKPPEAAKQVKFVKTRLAFKFHTFAEGLFGGPYNCGTDYDVEAIGWGDVLDAQVEDLISDARTFLESMIGSKALLQHPTDLPMQFAWIAALNYDCEYYDGEYSSEVTYLGRVEMTGLKIVKPGEQSSGQDAKKDEDLMVVS